MKTHCIELLEYNNLSDIASIIRLLLSKLNVNLVNTYGSLQPALSNKMYILII